MKKSSYEIIMVNKDDWSEPGWSQDETPEELMDALTKLIQQEYPNAQVIYASPGNFHPQYHWGSAQPVWRWCPERIYDNFFFDR